MKSAKFTPTEKIPLAAQSKISTIGQSKGRAHSIIQLSSIPTEAERKELAKQGITLLEYIPDNAWLASIKGSGLSTASQRAGITFVSTLSAADKIDSYLLRFGAPAYAKNPDRTANYSVQFFMDVSQSEIKSILKTYNAVGVPPLGNRTWIVTIFPEKIPQFADEDIVQYIAASPAPLRELNDGARASVSANTVQAAPYNLNGSGVVLAEWDSGYANHADYNSRRTIGDSGGADSSHSAHVAGTMLGDGSNSASQGGTAAQWRGIATNATLITFEWPDDTNELDSESNTSVASYEAVLSQNSWGYSASGDCGVHGRYDSWTQEYDNIAYGDASVIRGGKPLIFVFAAGNERTNISGCIGVVSSGGSDANGYGSILGPGQTAKNVLTVGAVNSNDNSISYFTSFGPADDGRLKPEVVAPGAEVGGDGGIKSTELGDTYSVKSGTSMASPVVSGIIGLIVQDFRTTHSNQTPKPATVKAILAHTATDLNNTGPDFTSGYGLVNATAAIDLIRRDNSTNLTDVLIEDNVTTTANKTYEIRLPTGQSYLKLTLAWDDYKGSVSASKELVNDLDLVVFAPNNTQAWPWTLSNASRSLNASRNQTDNINVIEQVYVGNPPAGFWRVYVNGTIAQGARQNFSLASSYSLNSTDIAFNVSALNIIASAGQSITDVVNVSCAITNNNTNLTKIDINSTTMISANATTLGNIAAGKSIDVLFTCAPTVSNASGIYQAIYLANSSNNTAGTNLTVYCIARANEPAVVAIQDYTNNTSTSDATPSIIFNFTDTDNTTAVSVLFFNGTGKAYNTTSQNSTNTTLTPGISISEGIYSIWVNVSDNISNVSSPQYKILVDTTMPPNVTSLAGSSAGPGWINWSWTNPIDNVSGVHHAEVYLNDTFKANASVNYYNATGLTLNSNYTLQVRPVDTAGNIGNWTNATANTIFDTTAPTVSLSSPANGTSTTTAAQTFTCTAIDNYNLSNMSFWIGSGGTWSLDQTSSATGESATKSFSKTLSVGTYSWNCMANDTSAKSAFGTNRTITITSGDTATTSTGGGGGGGGGGGAALPSENKLIGAQTTDRSISLSFEKTSSHYIDAIGFKTVNELENAYLQVTRFNSRPSSVPADAGDKVFAYIEIKPLNFKSSDIKDTEIKFIANKSWVSWGKISADDVVLREYKESWTDLPTKKYGETPDEYLYKETAATFSYLAIAAKPKPAVQEKPNITKPNLTAAEEPNITVPEKNISKTAIALPTSAEIRSLLKLIIGVIVLVVIIFAAIEVPRLLKIRKKAKKEEEKEAEKPEEGKKEEKKSFYDTV